MNIIFAIRRVGHDGLERFDMQMPSAENLVLQELLSAKQRGRLSAVEQAVLELGRAYHPGSRPKGFRLRAAKQCFYNVGDYGDQRSSPGEVRFDGETNALFCIWIQYAASANAKAVPLCRVCRCGSP